MSEDLDSWLRALESRHTRDMRPQDLLKAIRALSARYVERRADLRDRSPIDSRGKRAAFAAFFAPLHFVITREIVRAVDAGSADLDRIVDLGCGTGAASAAWALGCRPRVSPPGPTSGVTPEVVGIDRDRWSLEEARWNWRRLGVRGRTRQSDFVREAVRAAEHARRGRARQGVIAAWSVNELEPQPRAILLDALVSLMRAGTTVLVIEPIARRVSPWWPDWADAFTRAGGRADAWRFESALPAPLARLSEGAGFQRDELTARGLWYGPINRVA